MALTMTAQSQGNYSVADDGRYLCRIAKITLEDRPSFEDPNVLKPQFTWVFETVEDFDDDNRPYRFYHFTGVAYGNEKAKLTHLINGIFGRNFLEDQVNQMDLEKLIGKQVFVVVTVNDKGRNRIASVKPSKRSPIQYEDVLRDGADESLAPPKTRQMAADGMIDDPFADE